MLNLNNKDILEIAKIYYNNNPDWIINDEGAKAIDWNSLYDYEQDTYIDIIKYVIKAMEKYNARNKN